MSKENHQNSTGSEQSVTLADHCRIMLEDLLVFIIFFSVSALIILSFFTILIGIDNRTDNKGPRSCSWPPEWCSFLNKEQKSRPFILLKQQENNRSIPKYNHVFDYMFRSP